MQIKDMTYDTLLDIILHIILSLGYHTIIAQSSPQALRFPRGFAKRRARNASDC